MKNTYSGPRQLEESPLWQSYRNGFGKLSLEAESFWMGNAYLRELTNQDDYQLRIDMERATDGVDVYSLYAFFQVGKEQDAFKLGVGDCKGTAGDVLGYRSTTPLGEHHFSTLDKYSNQAYGDNVKQYGVGWWYPTTLTHKGPLDSPEPCFTNLNSPTPYYCDDNHQPAPLISVIMKIRPNNKDTPLMPVWKPDIQLENTLLGITQKHKDIQLMLA